MYLVFCSEFLKDGLMQEEAISIFVSKKIRTVGGRKQFAH